MQNFELDFNKNPNLVESTPHKKKFDIELFTLVPLSQKIYRYDEIEYEIYEKLKKKYKPEEIPFFLRQELETIDYFYDVDSDGNLLPKLESILRSEDIRDALYNHNSKYTAQVCLGYTNDDQYMKIWSSKKNVAEIPLNGIYAPKTKMTTYYIECTQNELKQQILQSRPFKSYDDINKEELNEKSNVLNLKDEWAYSSIIEAVVLDPNDNIYLNMEDSENKYDFILKAHENNELKLSRFTGGQPYYIAEKDRNGFVYNLIHDKSKSIPQSYLQHNILFEKETIYSQDKSYMNKLDFQKLNNYLILCDGEYEKDFDFARIISCRGNEINIKRLKIVDKKNVVVVPEVILAHQIRKVFAVPVIQSNLLILNELYTFIHQNEILTARLIKITKKMNNIIGKSNNNNMSQSSSKDSEGYMQNKIYVPNVGYIFPTNENYSIYASETQKEKKTTNINKYFADFQNIPIVSSQEPFDTETMETSNDIILVFRLDNFNRMEQDSQFQEILVSFSDFKKLYLHSSSLVEFIATVKKNDIIISSSNDIYYYVESKYNENAKKSSIQFLVSDRFNDSSKLVPLIYENIRGHIPFHLNWHHNLILTIPVNEKVENPSVGLFDNYKYMPNLYQLLKIESKFRKGSQQLRAMNDLELRDYLYSYSYHDTYATTRSIVYPMFQHNSFVHTRKCLKRKRHMEQKISDLSKEWSMSDRTETQNESKSASKFTVQKTIDQKIVDSILSVENINKRNALLSEYIEKYCFLFQDTESKEWWYYVIRDDEKIPVLCIHHKFIINNDKDGLNDILEETKDGVKICKNCKLYLRMQDFDTFGGFDDSNNVNQFREKSQNIANGVEFAGMGDKNLGKFFNEINISKTQFPTSKSLVPSEFQFTTTEKDAYGKIGNSFAVTIFEDRYKKLKLDNSAIYSNLLQSGSLFDNYMTYLSQNPESYNFEFETLSMKAKIELEQIKLNMKTLETEIRKLKTTEPKGEKIKNLCKEYKIYENKYKDVKKIYESKPIQGENLSGLTIEFISKIPIENKFGLAVMVAFKHWYLSFYGNRFENIPGEQVSISDFNKKFETVWFEELNEYPQLKKMYYYLESQLQNNASIQEWKNMHKSHLMTSVSQHTSSFSDYIKGQNVYDYFRSLGGAENYQLDEKDSFRQDYNIPNYIIRYPGNIDWNVVQEIIEYHTNVYYDQPTEENYNRLISMNQEVQNEWRNYKEWYQQNYYLFLKAKQYEPLEADTAENKIKFLQSYFEKHNIDASGVQTNVSQADLLAKYEQIYFNFKFSKIQNQITINTLIKPHLDFTTYTDTFEFINFKTSLGIQDNDNALEIYSCFTRNFGDILQVVQNVETFIYNMQIYKSSVAQTLLQNLFDDVLSSFDLETNNLLMQGTTVASFLSEWMKRYNGIVPKYQEFMFEDNQEKLVLKDKDTSVQVCNALVNQLFDFNRFFNEITQGKKDIVSERIRKIMKMKNADNKEYEDLQNLLGDAIENTNVYNPMLDLMNNNKINCLLQYILNKPDISMYPILFTNAITFYFIVFFGFNDKLSELPNPEDSVLLTATEENKIKVKLFIYYFKKQMKLKREINKSMLQTRKEIQDAGYYENFPPTLNAENYVRNSAKYGVKLINLQETLDLYRKERELSYKKGQMYPVTATEYLVESELEEEGIQSTTTNYQIYNSEDQNLAGPLDQTEGTEGLIMRDIMGIDIADIMESGDDPNEMELNDDE